MPETCPSCGAAAASNYCGECGARIASSTNPIARVWSWYRAQRGVVRWLPVGVVVFYALAMVAVLTDNDEQGADAAATETPTPTATATPTPEPAATTATATPTPEPVIRASHGVPVPAGSTPHESVDDAFLPSMSFDDLVAWYDEQMPVGEDFGDWTWCELWEGDVTVQRTYYVPGESDILAVMLFDEDPVGVMVGSDESGSGVC